MDLRLIDTTLRDGEQESDVFFSRDEKETIVSCLAEAGIRFLEAGIPVSGDVEFIKSLRFSPFTAICWCRARPGDIEAALKCGTGALHISFPISPLLLNQISWSADELVLKLEELLLRYRKHCDFLSIGAMDVFRADFSLLQKFVSCGESGGADMIRFADTTGTAGPGDVAGLFSRFSGEAQLLEFHGHNDLGMAVANSLTAVQFGAGGISGTLCGIGERAGNTPLEEIAMAVHLKAGAEFLPGISLKSLMNAARTAAEILQEPIPRRKPHMGQHVFRHESGIHVRGMSRDPESFQPYSPELIGAETDYLMGSSSGRSVIRLALSKAGLPPAEEHLQDILDGVRERSLKEKRSFSLEEIRSFL